LFDNLRKNGTTLRAESGEGMLMRAWALARRIGPCGLSAPSNPHPGELAVVDSRGRGYVSFILIHSAKAAFGANSLSNFWTGKDAKRWSDHVGEYGDPFQQRYLKAYILSCIIDSQQSKMRLESIFPLILHRTMEVPLNRLSDENIWQGIVAEFAGSSIDLTEHLVIDFGCGEGFMERFLHSFNATCVGLDSSVPLIAEARRKLASVRNPPVYETVDLKAQDLDLNDLISALIRPKSIYDFKTVLILCLNVLDHIGDPTIVVKQARSLCGCHGDTRFIVSTLNPTFFVKLGPPHRLSASELCRQAPLDLQLLKGAPMVQIFPRGWGAYNEFFSSASFNIDYFCATDLDDFPDDDISSLVPDWPRAGGPFLLWRLTPTESESVGLDALDHIFSRLSIFSNIDPKICIILKNRIRLLSLKKFEPNSLVAMPGAICHGLNIVTDGSFVVTIDKAVVQEFTLSGAFGDLESCLGFYAGRYLYEVRSGNEGGTCLEIPTSVLYEILNGDSDNTFNGNKPSSNQNKSSPNRTSLGDRLFLSARDRFNAYNPFYHRSIDIRPSQHPSPRVRKSKYLRNNRNLSVRDIEHVIRCLVTLVNLQEEKFYGINDVDSVPGLALFVNPKDLKIWLSGREPGAKERPFASELAALHKLGIIDAFSIPRIDESRDELRNMINGFYEQLVRAAVGLIVGNRFAGIEGSNLSERQLTTVIQQGHIDQLVTSQVVRNLNAEAIRLTGNCQRAMIESENSLDILFGHKKPKQAKKIAIDYYYNIAFLKWALFGRDERRLVVVRDYQFFRRVTGGGVQWIDELEARLELRARMVKEPRDWSHLARVENYFHYATAYVLGHWRQGWDLDYSGRGRKPEGSWRSLIPLN
jgi:2-polyprenyl-3-methyl-5-hydroxy-6-metoxy-1,4-benzoquinol methylase